MDKIKVENKQNKEIKENKEIKGNKENKKNNISEKHNKEIGVRITSNNEINTGETDKNECCPGNSRVKKAVVLLSGGLDSATALYLAKSQGYEIYAMSFDYGQRHSKELECAKAIATKAGAVRHIIVKTDFTLWGGSALTDNSIDLPPGDENRKDIPNTYVPARNMIFLSYAASFAEAIGSQDVFIGVSEVDYSGYVDCRQEFIDAMENAINQGTVCSVIHGKKIRLKAPFISMKKSEEIELGMKLGVDYGLTWSCYKGDEKACGACDSCLLRLKAFKEAGHVDPIKYEEK